MINKLLLAVCACVIASSVVHAVVELVEFETPQLEQRYRNLIDELRCVVCQNQNLADSDAPLAKDLRNIAAQMLRSGATDQEIKDFMRERYGDFVLYKPPFNTATAFLWLSPIVLLLIVLTILFIHIKRRQQDELLKPAHAGNDTERVKVRNLLRDTPTINADSEQQ